MRKDNVEHIDEITDLKKDDIATLYKYAFNRIINDIEANNNIQSFKERNLYGRQIVCELTTSCEFMRYLLDHAIDVHLYLINSARIKMIMSLLPPAKNIVDLGGANGSIYEMGYPHNFDKITVVDLPPEERCDQYKDIELKPWTTPNGKIFVEFQNMTNLEIFKSDSVDLVWSGQSIEHISEEDGKKALKEAHRILKPEGYFCLDTPNRLLTKIHTKTIAGRYIHPEHKIEYYPEKLKKTIEYSGFKIICEKGICEMPTSWKTKEFEYKDFVLGNPISDNINASYIQFYKCQKA